ncbi:MAG: hypothetical protein R3D58_01340 [Saprospiraceae bacterium]
MKHLIFLFTAILFFQIPYASISQKAFIKGTVEIFDKYETSIKRIGGERETFRMSLIRSINQTTKDTTIGVNIEIESTKKSDLITSTGFTITSNFDVGMSASKIEKIDRQKGSVLLTPDEFNSLIDFFNETIAIKTKEPVNDMGWQLTIEERFILALLFEANPGLSGQKWKYYIRLDDAEFETPYEDAIAMFRKLGAFQMKMQNGLK